MSMDEIALNIIDNSPGRELVDVIKDQLKKSKEAKFAIGYFFLSGFSLVKDDFPDKYEKLPFLKIVMGNETTYPTKEELVAGYNLREIFKQRMIEELQNEKLTEEQREKLIKRLRALREFIANNVIDVKLFDKSRLHAKLYLFLTNPGEKYSSPGLAVVGSSNFTAEGLTQNKELNVLLTSREEVLYLNQWFDKLWSEAIDFREDLLKVIDLSGLLPESSYPPIGRVLDPETLFKYLVYRWTDGRVLNLTKKDVLMEFQIVGVLNAVNIIGDGTSGYNGVILADSVGLGKSFMAAAVIEEFLYGKHPTWVNSKEKKPGVLLILPPSTIPQWEELLIGRLNAEIKSRLESGEKLKIDSDYFFKDTYKRLVRDRGNNKVYEIYDESGNELGKIEFLSLGIFQNYKVDEKRYVNHELERLAEEYDLFVIDEAHKFRNKNTNRWKAVRKLQKKGDGFPNKFILMTATPLNNSIHDILNLIRLFVDDTYTPFKIRGVNVPELIKKYKDLKRELKDKDDDNIRRDLRKTATEIKQKILDEIMVLRTRKYIKEQFKDLKVNGKPLVFKDPQPYSFEYHPFYTSNYQSFLKLLEEKLDEIRFEHTKLYGTRFVVFEEEDIEGEEGKKYYVEIADLFKLLLGKRLESGIYPFETTLRRIYEREKIFYELFKSRMVNILSIEDLRKTVEDAIERAKIKRELEEVVEEYGLEEEGELTWLDRVVITLRDYAGKTENKELHSDFEVLKIGLEKVLDIIEKDLRIMDEIIDHLDRMKEKENGVYKELGRVPRKEDDITEMPIFCYRSDPKLESLKQILGDPSVKSERIKDIPSLHGKKIIIFTQYRDTAYYLFHNLLNWVEKEQSLQRWLKDGRSGRIKIGLVTGDTDTSTKINYIKRFAPQANNGWDEVEKAGELEILVSTDALSEGVNLQDADAVINYDLPWNPMVIVQRVGRVNRIGKEEEVIVINYLPSSEIEIIVGILNKLKEKIRDITLVVGKETKILSPEEEISVETFGERIKSISYLSMTELERYGLSDDFREFIPEGVSQEQLDEYKLLNVIQYELQYTKDDFKEVIDMADGPYYSFLSSPEEKIFSVYEFYRGKYKIGKKIVCFDLNSKNLSYATPIVFLDLVRKRKKSPEKIETAIETMGLIKREIEKTVEELRSEHSYIQRGFLNDLYNKLLTEDSAKKMDKDFEKKYKVVMTALQTVPYYLYTRDIKSLLIQKNLIETRKNNLIAIKDFMRTIETLYAFFHEKGLSDIESLKVRVSHLGWWYEL